MNVAADFAVSWDGEESQNCGIFLGPLIPSQCFPSPPTVPPFKSKHWWRKSLFPSKLVSHFLRGTVCLSVYLLWVGIEAVLIGAAMPISG